MVLYLASYMATMPEVFEGMLKIRIGTPLQKRQLDGAVHRTPLDFYHKVWNVLCNSPGGIMVSQHHLHQLPTISDMTQNEINFQLKVEELLNGISNPEHRQLIVELIVVLATILQRNPEVKFEGCVDLDAILQDAINIFYVEQEKQGKPATRESFYNTPSEGKGGTTAYLTRALVNRLLGEGLDHTACSIC
ncbi:Phosphorylase b kinase regulatory subunit beta [Exaiptasia diaphana]|nr:Phosphorylase b kinase regulatory subunit beta [Exaiptasia diaphana]